MVTETTPGSGASDLGHGTEGIAGQAGEGEEVAKLRADNTRLRQDLARVQKAATAALPLAQIADKLIRAPGGKEIVGKLERGEALTATEAKKVEGVVATEAPLTKAEIQATVKELLKEAVGEIGETVASERRAAKSIEELEAKGLKELEGFEHMKQDPQFQRFTNEVLEQIKDGTIELPKEEKDVWWFAVKTAHKLMQAMHGAPKKGKTETERVAEVIAAGGTRPSSATARAGEEIPEELKERIEKIRQIGTRSISGKSFSNPKANR